jgi:hypothetical protein
MRRMPLGHADLERVNQRLLRYSEENPINKEGDDMAMDYADGNSQQDFYRDMESLAGRSKYQRSTFSALSCRGLKRPIIASATTCSIILLAHAS